MSLTAEWCSRRYVKTMPSCPSSRRRSSGKSRRSTESGREGREGLGLHRRSRIRRKGGSGEQVLRLVQRTWMCRRARSAKQGQLLWKVHNLLRGVYLRTTAFKVIQLLSAQGHCIVHGEPLDSQRLKREAAFAHFCYISN